ncbi:MAG TPA: hypothetical protein VGO72_01935 [Herminiimonas sp.]|jgi:hypothetical protein|nr:hypothetical protein [Herminiimonas sp.]
MNIIFSPCDLHAGWYRNDRLADHLLHMSKEKSMTGVMHNTAPKHFDMHARPS